MKCAILFFVGLLSLANAEVPCRLYDVTTMVRLLGKKSKGVTGISNYEVHSRTNAVGAPVEFNHPDWFTSFKDPLESNRCIFSAPHACKDWTIEGFTPARWVENDPLFNWEKVSNQTRPSPEEIVTVSVNDTGRQLKWMFKYPLSEGGALKLRLRPDSGLKFFIGLHKRDRGVAEIPDDEGVALNFDFPAETGSGDDPYGPLHNPEENPFDDDGSEDDPWDFRPIYTSSHGVEFTFLSNSSTVFEEKKLISNDGTFKETVVGHQGVLESARPGAVVTLILTKNDDGTSCLWADNSRDTALANRRCLLVLPSGYDGAVLVIDRRWEDFSNLHIYRADLKSAAVKSSRDPSWVMTPEMPPGRKGGVCVSLRYYSNKGSRTKVNFLPVINGTEKEALRSAYVQGSGNPVTTQFEIVKSKSLRKVAWKLKLEFSSNGTFILQSIRRCSGKGRDDIIVPLWMPEYRNASHGRILMENGDEGISSMDRAIDALVPKIGLGLKCPHTELPLKSEVNGTECYNGGVKIDGECQCFPGFTGPLCKKACPPERFGADCSGSCNHLGKHDCVGIKMAAPGSKLQCARGYYGPQCDKKCQTGFYGQDCQLKCGRCLRETCNRYTGLCDGRCLRGHGGPYCDTEVAEVYKPYINATGYNFIEGYLDIPLTDETIRSYPFFEIRYVLLKIPHKKSKKLLKLTSKTPVFRIERMKPGQRYRLHAVLVHQSGEVSRGDVRQGDTTLVETDCNAVTNFTDVDVDPGKGVLSLRWNVTERDDPYPCQRIKYKIEIDSDNLEDPIMEEAEPNDNHKTITALLPNEGTVRLKAIYVTKEGEWSDHYPFLSSVVTEKPSVLNVLNKTSRWIEFHWSKSDTGLEDVMTCEGEAMLCRGIPRGKVKVNVKEGMFKVENLDPFTVYTCTLENFGTTVSTITDQEVPSVAPKQHSTPVKSIKNTTATIQWHEPECFGINGLLEGFKLMLHREGKLINIIQVSEDTSMSTGDEHTYTFEDLEPDAEYEVKVFVLNHVGENPKYPLNIAFRTKSANPEAVRNLIVYKRTTKELWLRWSEPEDFTYIAGSSAKVSDDFKIVYTYPGGVFKSEEIAMSKCKTWPEYFCHRIRGLVPNKNYTVSVLSRDHVNKMYGPSTQVNATTTEGVPDAPENLRLVKTTTNSIVVSWEIPVMLNSNTRYFVAAVEESGESGSQEFDSPVTKIPISDGIHLYQAKFDNVRPASTYTVTVGAGIKGTRSTLTVHTPPPDPPSPLSPDLTVGSPPEVVVIGLNKASEVKNLRGYLLLVTSKTDHPDIFNKELQSILEKKISENFIVVEEYPASLVIARFDLVPSDNFNGTFSVIKRPPFLPQLWISLAAVCEYNGLYSASVSDATLYDGR